MKAKELREMSDEQLRLTAVEAAETAFRLRLKHQTERLDTPSELRKNRRLIARIKTLQSERQMSAIQTAAATAAAEAATAAKTVTANPAAAKPAATKATTAKTTVAKASK